MQVSSALIKLRGQGYRFTVRDGDVKVKPPARKPPEADALLEILRADRAAVLEALQFHPVSASEGERHEISLGNESDIRRWAYALEAGLIVLDGPVRLLQRQNIVHLRYRAAMPEEWVADAITSTCKRKYNALLERISKGKEWLKANADDPRYETTYCRFLGLFDDLMELYAMIGEELNDPLEGYQMATQ